MNRTQHTKLLERSLLSYSSPCFPFIFYVFVFSFRSTLASILASSCITRIVLTAFSRTKAAYGSRPTTVHKHPALFLSHLHSPSTRLFPNNSIITVSYSHNHSIHNTILSFRYHSDTHQRTSFYAFPSFTSTQKIHTRHRFQTLSRNE